MRTFESKQKQHKQQHQKPGFFCFVFPGKMVLVLKWGGDAFKDFM
jgi:hypothetical protein